MSNTAQTAAALDRPISTESNGKKSSRKTPPFINKALAKLEESAGGRAAFLETLQSTDGLTKEEETLVTLLAHPSYHRHTFASLCVIAKVTAAQAIRLFTKAKGAQAYQVAITKIYEKLPEVAEDVAFRSLPHTDTCPSCQGQPVPEDGTSPCRKCRGRGVINKPPSIKHQEWSLQIGELLKPAGGVTINNNQMQLNNNGAGVVRTSSDFRAATDKLLYPGRQRALPSAPVDIVDAEPTTKESIPSDSTP